MSELSPLLDRVAEKPHVPLAIVGDPGSGKTSQIEQWAKERNLPCVKLLTSTLDETDVAGIMVRDGDNAKTLSPNWINQLQDRGILFLDELNCGHKEVVDTLLTLICSRHLPNGDKLGEGVMIVAAMNDAEQCDNYELSPAMRTRFMWVVHTMPMNKWAAWFLGNQHKNTRIPAPTALPKYQTMEDWLAWFQADPEHGADKKALLTEAIKLGLVFDEGKQYVDKQTPTCPRGLTNLFYWTRNAYEAVQWAPAFIDDAAVNVLRSVNVASYRNVGNSIFNNGRAKQAVSTAEEDKLSAQQSIISKIQAAAGITNS